jgi:hypothetical protein
MDDAMIDLMAGDAQLQRRLAAFAEARLSPDPAATRRIRARVLATAHRQAAISRADTALAVVQAPRARPGSRTLAPVRRLAAGILAATLVLSAVVGTAAAARPGGPLYDTRLWLETLTLPADPSSRAVAGLGRLADRLAEAADASTRGDVAGVSAALTAYDAIMTDAASRTAAAHDAVATAAMEAGLARNLVVLRALADRLPAQATPAIGAAIDRAIIRSDAAVDAVTETGGSPGDRGSHGNDGTNAGDTNRGGGDPAASARTTDATPTGTPKPSKPPAAKPTNAPTTNVDADPTKAPKPDKSPAGNGPPSDPPGGGGHGGGGKPGG